MVGKRLEVMAFGKQQKEKGKEEKRAENEFI